MNKEELQEKLIVGAMVRIGKESSLKVNIEEGQEITLIQGFFEHDNGLYTEDQECPSILEDDEFSSIYHIFGNDLEDFLDSEII